MPYDSLVALGNKHPLTVSGVASLRPTDIATQRFRPDGPSTYPTSPVERDEYLGPAKERFVGRHQLREVRVEKSTVTVHPSWRNTVIGEAIGPDGMLDINRITPQMICAMPRDARTELMELLATVRTPISWCDESGHWFRRHLRFRLPIGKHFEVNCATALTLRMAATSDHCAFLSALRDGLNYTVDEFQGPEGGNLFSTAEVASVIVSAIEDVMLGVSPGLSAAHLSSVATLVAHHLRQTSKQAPNALHESMRAMMQTLGELMPQNPAHIGLAAGLVLSGGLRYAGQINAKDYHRRWRVASIGNFAWALQSFVPFAPAAGAAASTIVGSAIWWDYLHPQRDYSDVMRRFQSEFELMGLWGKLNLTEAETGIMFNWMRVALHACCYQT